MEDNPEAVYKNYGTYEALMALIWTGKYDMLFGRDQAFLEMADP